MPESLMLPIDLQETNERRFSPKHIDSYLRQWMDTDPVAQGIVTRTTTLVEQWLDAEHFAKKAARLAQLKALDIPDLVKDLLVRVAYFRTPELFTGVTGQLAFRLGFDEKKDSIQTVAELLAVMSDGLGFHLIKENRQASLMLVSDFVLPSALVDAIERSLYLPPMVCEPTEITNNFESGYLTHNDCVVLGKGNGHTGNLCLDVINTQNRVTFKLDLEFLCNVEEEPNHALDDMQTFSNWQDFKIQSYELYTLLATQNNQFWFTHKVDKRGRLYSQGYHVNPQGTPFKKAMLELNHEEVVQGVPNEYQNASHHYVTSKH